MKTIGTITAAAVLSLALGACVNEGGDDQEEHLRVYVVDSVGAAHPADTVYWSYAPDAVHAKAAHSPETDSVMRPAACANADCSQWVIEEHVHGDLYVRASYSKATSPFCGEHAYAVKHVDMDTVTAGVTVRLDVDEDCL